MSRRKGREKIAPFPRRKQSGFGVFRLTTIAGLFVLAFFSLLIIVQMFQFSRLQKKLVATEHRVTEKELRNETISEEIGRLGDPGYIGMLARKLLGLTRPGEIVFQLED